MLLKRIRHANNKVYRLDWKRVRQEHSKERLQKGLIIEMHLVTHNLNTFAYTNLIET